jgi:hypothetical protein
VPSAAGLSVIDVGLGEVAPVKTERPVVGSERGDAAAVAVTAVHTSQVRMGRPAIARNVSPR